MTFPCALSLSEAVNLVVLFHVDCRRSLGAGESLPRRTKTLYLCFGIGVQPRDKKMSRHVNHLDALIFHKIDYLFVSNDA
jgi:hypothetical protein